MTLCLVELGVKCVLHQIIQGLVHDVEDAPPSPARPATANPPIAAASAGAAQAASLVTPEMVERVLRRVLPQVHRRGRFPDGEAVYSGRVVKIERSKVCLRGDVT